MVILFLKIFCGDPLGDRERGWGEKSPTKGIGDGDREGKFWRGGDGRASSVPAPRGCHL